MCDPILSLALNTLQSWIEEFDESIMIDKKNETAIYILTELSILSRLVEYIVNALIIMTHISTAQQVGLKMLISLLELSVQKKKFTI